MGPCASHCQAAKYRKPLLLSHELDSREHVPHGRGRARLLIAQSPFADRADLPFLELGGSGSYDSRSRSSWGVVRGVRVTMNPTSSTSATTPPATTHQRVEECPPVLAEVPVWAGVVSVAVACCPGDEDIAVKENWPLTGWPSFEDTRQVTVYRPAGEPGRRCSVTVVSTSTASPV